MAIEVLSAMLPRPTIIHCAAGKDRTGIVVALTRCNIQSFDDFCDGYIFNGLTREILKIVWDIVEV